MYSGRVNKGSIHLTSPTSEVVTSDLRKTSLTRGPDSHGHPGPITMIARKEADTTSRAHIWLRKIGNFLKNMLYKYLNLVFTVKS